MPTVPSGVTAQRHGGLRVGAQSRTEHQRAKLMPGREERAMSQVIGAGQPSDERRLGVAGWGVASAPRVRRADAAPLLAAAAIGVKFFAQAPVRRPYAQFLRDALPAHAQMPRRSPDAIDRREALRRAAL